jgi:hypothetical protein
MSDYASSDMETTFFQWHSTTQIPTASRWLFESYQIIKAPHFGLPMGAVATHGIFQGWVR